MAGTGHRLYAHDVVHVVAPPTKQPSRQRASLPPRRDPVGQNPLDRRQNRRLGPAHDRPDRQQRRQAPARGRRPPTSPREGHCVAQERAVSGAPWILLGLALTCAALCSLAWIFCRSFFSSSKEGSGPPPTPPTSGRGWGGVAAGSGQSPEIGSVASRRVSSSGHGPSQRRSFLARDAPGGAALSFETAPSAATVVRR